MVAALGGTPVLFALPHRDKASAPELPWESYRLGRMRMMQGRPLIAAELDLLHLAGIWHWPSIAARRWSVRAGRPLVISPHGMLADWIVNRNRWKKGLWQRVVERPAWVRAAIFHALTTGERDEIARRADAEAAIIPNTAPPASPARDAFPPPQVLYLGRIHPKKNLPAAIAGWERADPPGGSRFLIAGWGAPGDEVELRRRIARSPRRGSISFLGAVHGERKAQLLRESRFTLLPSLSEGLPMSVLESWAAGTPALVSSACRLPEGFAAGAAIDCGTKASTVGIALSRALAMPPAEWFAMSASGQTLAQTHFGADEIARAWAEIYGLAMRGDAALP
jgi:poly(glycerol-phosphate) alpha-glucosyltransferase